MKRILCIGDAVTLGVRSTRGYPEHLWEILTSSGQVAIPGGVLVQNAGLSEGGLVDVLRRLPSAFGIAQADVVVLLAPPFDARGGGTPPREFRALMVQTVEAALSMQGRQAQTSGLPRTMVLCSPTPIGETDGQRGHVRSFGRPSRRWVPKAAEIVREVAADHGLPYVDLHEMPRDLLADSVHLKPAGYRWVAEMVAPVVRAALGV